MSWNVLSWKSAAQVASVLIGAIAVVSAGSPARADINLVVGSSNTFGLMAGHGTNLLTGTTASNPISLNLDGDVFANFQNDGSDVQFSFKIVPSADSAFATTAVGPPGLGNVTAPQAMAFTIVGTNGEAAGTPVYLDLHTQFAGTADAHTHIDNHVFAPQVDKVLNGYGVGGTFLFWPSVSVDAENGANFSGTLSVHPGVGVSAAPEPGALALLGTGGICLQGFLKRRRCGRGHHL
jgi:hypothetical protein